MKNIIITIILCFAGFISIGQSAEWKVIGSPDTAGVEIAFLSSSNELFGYNRLAQQLLYSNDSGKTWTSLKDDYYYPDFREWPIVENYKKEIYFFNEGYLYRVDKNPLRLSQLLKMDDNTYIGDVAFFENGNYLVGTESNIYLYTDNHSFIKKVALPDNRVKFLLGKTNQKHYITHDLGSFYALSEITEDNLKISNSKLIQQKVIRSGNRLFIGIRYSDDGLNTIKNIPSIVDSFYNLLYLGNDNKLYYNAIFDTISIIDPIDLTIKSKFSKSDIYSILVDANSKIFINKYNCFARGIEYSEDSGKSWTPIHSEQEELIASTFTAGNGENIFVFGCEQLSLKSKNAADWKNFELSLFTIYDNVFSLSNGSIIAQNDFGTNNVTFNNGESWNEIYFPFYTSSESKIIEKSGVLNYVNYDSIYRSYDFGLTWNSDKIPDTIYFESNRYAFSEAKLFYFDIFSWDNPFKIYDIKTKASISSNIDPNYFVVAFETSFDTKSLYVLLYNNQNGYKVAVSNDEGTSFTYFTIPVKNASYSLRLTTDHLGNVYVFSDSQVLISKDHGATWTDITPSFPNVYSINDLKVSFDNYVYLSTNGYGVLKFKQQLAEPRQLTVTVYDDLNKNCIKDADEPGVPNAKIALNTNAVWPVDSTGNATIYTIYDNNELKLLYNQSIYKSCQDTYSADFDSMTTMLHLDIPLKALKYCAETNVSISAARLRRCFDNRYYGQVCNDGNITANNTEIKIFLDRYFEFVDATLPIISLQDSILILDAGDVAAGKCVDFGIGIKISCDAALGQEHCIKVDASHSSESCVNVAPRGAYAECQENIGSFDPNDKTIFVNGVRNQTYIEKGDNIEYMIRFQNTGTDTAFTVRIEDPISQKFNIRSIKPLSSSHPYEWSIDQNVLKLVFNKINLVDSFTNEPASNGFVKFSIEASESIINGQELSNQAGIYFDFNEPVITNQVVSSVGKPVGTIDGGKNHRLLVNPNPTAQATFIDLTYLTYQNSTFSIHDVNGKIIMSELVSRSSNRIYTADLAPGCYIISLKSGEQMAYGKLVKL